MNGDRFKVIIDKLPLQASEDWQVFVESQKLRAESEEIAELRRIALEATEPEPQLFTTT